MRARMFLPTQRARAGAGEHVPQDPQLAHVLCVLKDSGAVLSPDVPGAGEHVPQDPQLAHVPAHPLRRPPRPQGEAPGGGDTNWSIRVN